MLIIAPDHTHIVMCIARRDISRQAPLNPLDALEITARASPQYHAATICVLPSTVRPCPGVDESYYDRWGGGRVIPRKRGLIDVSDNMTRSQCACIRVKTGTSTTDVETVHV